MKRVIGTIYLWICVIRALILFETSLFPLWAYAIWVIIPSLVAAITIIVEIMKEGQNDK